MTVTKPTRPKPTPEQKHADMERKLVAVGRIEAALALNPGLSWHRADAEETLAHSHKHSADHLATLKKNALTLKKTKVMDRGKRSPSGSTAKAGS